MLKQRDVPPQSMFADFIESGTTGDIDVFLTRVCQMPAASQNKLLQEKILFLNEKLCNVFEEIANVKKFHAKTSRFLKAIRNKINHQKQQQLKLNEEMGFEMENSIDEQGISLDPDFAHKALSFAQKSITELE